MRDRRTFSSQDIVPLMNVGIVSTQSVAEGKLLPNIVLDISDHPNVAQYFDVHKNVSSMGDADTQWACLTTNGPYSIKGDMCLIFESLLPTQVMFGVIFKMEEHAESIDQIIRTKAVYLQASSPKLGKHVNFDSPRLLIEVPAEFPFKDWEKRLHRSIMKKFLRRKIKKKQAKTLATKYIEEYRQFGSKRLK